MEYLNGGVFESSGKWIHGERCIDSNELMYVTKGTVCLEEDGVEYRLEENDVILLERGKTHRGTEITENVGFLWFHFVGEFKVKRYHASGYHLQMLIRQLFHYENSPIYPKKTTNIMLELILTELEVGSAEQNESTLVNQICEWIRAHSNKKITVIDIAQRYSYNPDYLSRLVKAKHGVTLEKYIKLQRSEYIKKMLLSTENNISQVASLCGFDSYQSFLKYFEYHEKMSPSQYRKIYYGIHMNDH